MGWINYNRYTSASGNIITNFGSWTLEHNNLKDSLDFCYPGNGLAYKYYNDGFNGILSELEVNGGFLQIVQYSGWDETVSVDEAYVVGDEDLLQWDETVDGGVLLDAIFNTTGSPMYYELGGNLISPTIDLLDVGKFHSAISEWNLNTNPEGSTTKVYYSLKQDDVWGVWTEVIASGNAIGALPTADTDISECSLRYKIIMTPNADYSASPKLQNLVTTINSHKMMRISSTGELKILGAPIIQASEELM
jgi:hypothetical protein